MIKLNCCQGCYDNFYNQPGNSTDGMCWMRKLGKMVWRIPVGMWERPPYKGKKKVHVPSCWHGIGNNRTIMVSPEALTKEGFWK